jgi:hypothetical protein
LVSLVSKRKRSRRVLFSTLLELFFGGSVSENSMRLGSLYFARFRRQKGFPENLDRFFVRKMQHSSYNFIPKDFLTRSRLSR